MHQVHTLNPGCMHRPHALCPSSAHTAPCCGLWSVVLQGTPGSVAAHANLCRALCRACHVTAPPELAVAPIAASYVMSWRFPWSCRARIATQPSGQAARLSRYGHLYCDSISQQSGPRAHATRPCALADRFTGYIVAQPIVSRFLSCALARTTRSCRGPQAAPTPHLPSPMSRYNPLYRHSNGQ